MKRLALDDIMEVSEDHLPKRIRMQALQESIAKLSIDPQLQTIEERTTLVEMDDLPMDTDIEDNVLVIPKAITHPPSSWGFSPNERLNPEHAQLVLYKSVLPSKQYLKENEAKDEMK